MSEWVTAGGGFLLAVLWMLVTVGGSALELGWGEGALLVRAASLALCAAPTGLAAARVVPSAVRLGARADDVATQSALARAICRDHLLCFASIAAFLALRLAL